MRRQLFREEALAQRGRSEPLDGLLRVTAPHMWVVLAVLGLAFAGLGVWMLAGRVERTVEVACVLVRPGERHAVLSTVTGSVEEVLVSVGDEVEAAQPVARVRTPALERQLRTAQARLEILEAEVAGAPADALAAARAELADLEAERASGEFIVSPVSGEVASLRLAVGSLVEAGSEVARIRRGSDHRLEAVAFVAPADEQLIDPGMPARIVPAEPGLVASEALAAEVAHVSPRPVGPDEWLAQLGLRVPPRSHLVRLALKSEPGQVADGDHCRGRIMVSEQPPWRLLGAAGLGGRPA